jgi:L-rhamnose mutarotase
MKLNIKRHDEIWPNLQELLKDSGIKEYSIFLEEKTGHLFGFLKIEHPTKLDELPSFPVMQKWWQYMSDIMETNPDHSPIIIPLKEVFYLP